MTEKGIFIILNMIIDYGSNVVFVTSFRPSHIVWIPNSMADPVLRVKKFPNIFIT